MHGGGGYTAGKVLCLRKALLQLLLSRVQQCHCSLHPLGEIVILIKYKAFVGKRTWPKKALAFGVCACISLICLHAYPWPGL